ncbi:hypothetical protein ACGFNX_40220 [Streptomyces sp. NPDC048723]|uniref:hypothetical protein n=1 Tax=Streptomyces sp. NPDC048723 TaxID=3365589 RepID=UPI0037172513
MGSQINVNGAPQGPGKPSTALQLAKAIGVPPTKPLTDTPVLIAQEQQMLVRCEAALENLRIAFFAAGKALQVIRDAKLYRKTHKTFEEYTLDRWDITPQYAGKLIRSWRIAEEAFESASNDLETVVSKKLGFTHAWELVPLAEEHSVKAASMLYLALLKVQTTGITAAVVAGSVAELPAAAIGHKKKTEEFALDYLARLDGAPKAVAAMDPVKTLRALGKATRQFSPDAVKAALDHDPEGTRTAAKSLIEALSKSAGLSVTIEELAPAPEPTVPEAREGETTTPAADEKEPAAA